MLVSMDNCPMAMVSPRADQVRMIKAWMIDSILILVCANIIDTGKMDRFGMA